MTTSLFHLSPKNTFKTFNENHQKMHQQPSKNDTEVRRSNIVSCSQVPICLSEKLRKTESEVPKCQGIETSLLQDKDDWGWTVLHEAAAAGNKKGGILNLY